MESKSYTFDSLLAQLPEGRFRTIGNDFILAGLDQDVNRDFMHYPVRFDGYIVFYCLQGRFTLDLNLKSYDVSEGSLIIYSPGNIAKVTTCGTDASEKHRFIIAAASAEFVSSVRIDFNRLYEESLIARETPCISLNDKEKDILKQYYDLAGSLLSLKGENRNCALKALCSSAFYLFGSIWREHLYLAQRDGAVKKTRANTIFENFVKLVAQHHKTEHNVTFYADQLYLTPKYLSKLVKEVSGKSAPDWINSFIILEAKNLLKYSDISIKEIAYNMHFSTVPSFYKFFRKQTGMTPADYRKM
ncbi:MAG: helix-turn-helix transcriptional regulator [Bacteroidia bacterium]|nr:helix-turn-helix transcriptional regulator [Bacteroidia bacterium]